MKTMMLILAAALGGGVGLACASEPTPTQAGARISVVFVDPQRFTDLKQEEGGQTSPMLLDQLRDFMLQTGERSVPAGMHLDIRVTDVDLAGGFEPWRGPEFDRVRIVKSLYPPRLQLEFKLTDAEGRVVGAGDRQLTDLAFQTRDAFARPGDDYLRYEKDLLRDWFHREFKPVKVAGS
jgi:hypothetical protein